MYSASAGGTEAARGFYRHVLVRVLIPVLEPLAGCGWGRWTGLTVSLMGLLMSWEGDRPLAERFESARSVLDAAVGRRRRVPRSYQGLVKAMGRHWGLIRRVLPAHLRELTRRSAERAGQWRMGEFVPIGVDGSMLDAPRTIGNGELGLAGRDKCGPQMTLLLLVHLGVMLPWSFRVGRARSSERGLLRRVLKELPESALLVADAGFTGYDLLAELARHDVHFLTRVGRGVRLLRELGVYEREGQHTVYLWPDSRRDRPPMVLRLIKVGRVYLITNVLGSTRLSKKMAGALYRRRWGVEVAFRSLKQTLDQRKVRSGTAANSRMEASWSVLGMWTLGLLGVRGMIAAGHGPRRLSPAGALRAVRGAGPGTPERTLRGRLRRALRDPYRRRGPKSAYRHPNKKKPPLPGPPSITTATQAQIKLAQELQHIKQAA
jgi:hypothetical protein